jgi:hypothetical protein
MLLSEDEAKTKRCPEGFAAAKGISVDGIPVMQPESAGPAHPHGAAGYYAVSHGGAPMNCIGSECMAWRWSELQPYEYGKDLAEGMNPADPGWEAYGEHTVIERTGPVKYIRWRRPLPGRKGFCGKAGSPPRF